MPDACFCEECGAVIEDVCERAAKGVDSPIDGDKEIFSSSCWQDRWARAAANTDDADLGLIITREKALLQQLGGDSARFRSVINDYIRKSAQRGVKYYYLNLDVWPEYKGDGSVDSVVSVLRKIVEIARPKYLFILGNEDVIAVARWKNESNDSDEKVESDLCYSTLDVVSPWEGQKYEFDEVIRVGRLPTGKGESFDSFRAYFDSAIKHIGHMERIVPYGLSARVWEAESNDEFSKVTLRKVDVSPVVKCDSVAPRMGSESNLLFFNLHGSNRTEYWYGQDGLDYPEAFSPSVLKGVSRPYFIGVEACYGARYLDGLTSDESIVLTAMKNNCIAFLASSRIAYGSRTPVGFCADLVVGSFVKGISEGASAGDAHMVGLKRLTADWNSLDDADIKTMAEFALYGDPSARKGANTKADGHESLIPFGRMKKGLAVPVPDVRRAVRASVVEVNAKIEALVDDYVKREVLPELAERMDANDVTTRVLRMTKSGLNQKIYRAQVGAIEKVAKVYFDDEGQIRKTLVSK